MGGGLAFLTKKSFNPANWSNQRQVWEARQKHATEQRLISERESQLKREREEEEMARMTGGEEEGGRKALGFMYEGSRIPGLHREKKDDDHDADENDVLSKSKGEADEKSDSLFRRQPGDDDAAAAFRAMLARGAVEDAKPSAEEDTDANDAAAGATVDESQEEKKEHVDHRTALEKAVGRRINSGDLTLTQQMERFPMLKNAPMVLQKPKDGEQQQSNDVAGLNFKPLGQVLRNVKCMSCGKWGHSKGDRECEVSGWDPFSMSAPVASVAKKLPDTSTQVAGPIDTPADIDDHKTEKGKRKKEKARHKEDKHRRKDKHKRRRRSPSYSSDSDSDRKRYDDDDDSSHDRRRKKETRHRSSSRRSKRRRERSRSPSYYSDDSRR